MQLELILETEKIPVNAQKLFIYLLNVAMERVSRGRIDDVEKDGKVEQKTAINICLDTDSFPVINDHYIVKGNIKCIIESSSPIYMMELMYGLQSIRLFTHRQYQLIPKEIYISKKTDRDKVLCFVHHD